MLPVADFDSPDALRERLRAVARRRRRARAVSAALRRCAVDRQPITNRGLRCARRCDVPARRAVLRRSLSAPAGVPGNAAARCADESRGDARQRSAGDARRDAAAAARDARQDALVHRASQRLELGAELSPAADGVVKVMLLANDGRPDRRERASRARARHGRKGTRMTQRRRVAITGIGLVTPVGNDVATTWAALDGVKSGAAPITVFDASGFPTRIAAEVKGFDERAITAPRKLLNYANRSHRFALAAAEQAMRDAGIEPTDADRERWGCAVGTGMMGVSFDELAAVQRHSAADGELDPQRLLTDAEAADPLAFCRSQSTARPGAADAPVRHPRLRDVGPYRVRVGRPGDRHGAEAHPPRRGRPRARRRLRLDDQPDRPRGLLPAVRGVDRQRHAASARAGRSTRRATASCSAKARASSCSRNGKRRGGAARASTPSSPATATRCRRTGSPIRRPTATDRSSRCARRSRTQAPTPADIDYINAHGTSTGDERPQRERGDPRGVRRRREAAWR